MDPAILRMATCPPQGLTRPSTGATMRAADLISAVKTSVRQNGMLQPLRIRLVKLAYLAEVEYYRAIGGRLTDLEWIFYRYGPYAHELGPLIGGTDDPAAVAVDAWSPETPAKPDFQLESILRQVVKDWGDADLNQLLDFVYFETEPMEGAQRGQRLDFTNVLPRQPRRPPLRLDRRALEALRARAQQSAPDYATRPQPALLTPELNENLRLWDDDGALRLSPGFCDLNPSELV